MDNEVLTLKTERTKNIFFNLKISNTMQYNLNIQKGVVNKIGILSRALFLLAILFLTSCSKNDGLTDDTIDDSISLEERATKDFIKRKNAQLVVGYPAKAIKLYGVNFGNNSYFSDHSQNPYRWHHGEEAYQQMKAIGGNSIRFFLSYLAFEKQDGSPNPDIYSWIDENIAWAKKYGIYIILDFHYPKGGFADNWTIWKNITEQQKFIQTWKNIAAKYKNEPMIGGYELLNEPSAYGVNGSWYTVLQNCITAIRSVDKNHLIIVPRLEGSDSNVNLKEDNYYQVNDANIMYTFHFYEPYTFTHQNLVWAATPNGPSYPNPNYIIYPNDLIYGNNYTTATPIVATGNSEWKYYEGAKIKVESGFVKGTPQLGASIPQGTVYFDQMVIKEYDTNGNFVKDVVNIEIDNKRNWTWVSPSGQDKSVVIAEGYQDKTPSCIAINALDVNYGLLLNYTYSFAPKEGYYYSVSGWMKGKNIPQGYSATMAIYFEKSSSGSKAYPFTKAFLEAQMNKYIKYPKSQTYPIFLGEFAALDWGTGKGAEQWTSDIIDIAKQNNLHISYFEYTNHEADNDHVLYKGSEKIPNQPIINILKQKFK